MAGRDVTARRVGALAVLALLMGCYTLKPISGAEPKPGEKLAFDVNDAGRVALGGSMGPEISQVEGLLVEKDAEGYLLSVSSVRLLRGGEQVWSGERVRINNQFVGTTYTRKFSMGRSIGLGVVGIGGFGAILASTSLLGIGSDDKPGGTDTLNTRLGRP